MQQERGGTSDRLQGEVWRFFLSLMLLFLIAEGFLILPSGARETKRPARTEPRTPVEAIA
jgi:hypothetical protein